MSEADDFLNSLTDEEWAAAFAEARSRITGPYCLVCEKRKGDCRFGVCFECAVKAEAKE